MRGCKGLGVGLAGLTLVVFGLGGLARAGQAPTFLVLPSKPFAKSKHMPVVREAIKQALTKAGYQVVEAGPPPKGKVSKIDLPEFQPGQAMQTLGCRPGQQDPGPNC